VPAAAAASVPQVTNFATRRSCTHGHDQMTPLTRPHYRQEISVLRISSFHLFSCKLSTPPPSGCSSSSLRFYCLEKHEQRRRVDTPPPSGCSSSSLRFYCLEKHGQRRRVDTFSFYFLYFNFFAIFLRLSRAILYLLIFYRDFSMRT